MELLYCGIESLQDHPGRVYKEREAAVSALTAESWDIVIWNDALGKFSPELLSEQAGVILVSGKETRELYRWALALGCRQVLEKPEKEVLAAAIEREWAAFQERKRTSAYRSLFERYGDHLKVHIWFDLIVEGQYENLLEPVPYRMLLLYGTGPEGESRLPPDRRDSPTILSEIFPEAVVILALQRPWECAILPEGAGKLRERAARCQAVLEQRLGARREQWLSPPLLPEQLHGFYRQTVLEREKQQERFVSDQVCSYIQTHLGEKLTRKTISGNLFFSPDYLAKVFLAETGVTMGTYICQTRLERAKEQLLHTTLPVGSIAAGLGYQNFSEFSQWFKKQTGMTPSRYRKSGGV